MGHFFVGQRSLLHVLFGFVLAVLICSILFDDGANNLVESGGEGGHQGDNIQLAEKWERRVLEREADGNNRGEQQAKVQVNRARFAASELGIREPVLVLLLLRSAATGFTLHSLLSAHFPVRPIVDPSRADVFRLADHIVLRAHGEDQPQHIQALNAIANLSLQSGFDWFLLLPDSTYLNPFQLRRSIANLRWNVPLAMGHQRVNNAELCTMEAGVMLSNPAMRMLVEGRHLCRGIVAGSADSALEKCIRLATNLSCVPSAQGVEHRWSRGPSSNDAPPLHDQIPLLSLHSAHFNRSLTVSSLLSDRDVQTLHEHFLGVEIDRSQQEIANLKSELETQFGDEVGWPIGAPREERPPNRFQVPIWEMFTAEETLFGDDPDRNMRQLVGEERQELDEVMRMALEEAANGQSRKGTVMQGYRRFSAERGMEYLVAVATGEDTVVVHLCRPIHSTTLLDKVPYVKEDSDITIIVPVESLEQVRALRTLLHRLRPLLCQSPTESNRQTRIVVTSRSIEAALVRLLGADLVELGKKCKQRRVDSSLLLLKPDPIGLLPVEVAAMDAAVDRYGYQSLLLLLSPFSDFHRDFLDRVRLNTIRHFQAFFPIPFTEFNPFVTGFAQSDKQMFQPEKSVHKDRGRFDTEDFSVVALYGSDYVAARARWSPSAAGLATLFLGQYRIHLMRPVEPSLRIRFHPRMCTANLATNGTTAKECERHRREGLGTRAQLARLLFVNNEEESKSASKRTH